MLRQACFPVATKTLLKNSQPVNIAHPVKALRPPSVFLACDDECTGLLISDMDRLYRIIADVTLTTPLPPPYKLLYRFENMTEELKVTPFDVTVEILHRPLQP